MLMIVICLLMTLAVAALVGGISLAVQPSGAGLGMSTDMLHRAPVSSYRLPGIFLLFAMCLWPTITAVGIALEASWAPWSTIAVGAVAMAWILYQYALIRTFSMFQPAIFLIGVLLVVLGTVLV